MEQRIFFFGDDARGAVRLAHGHVDAVDVDRDVWFDRDIDGQWLVWAQDHDGTPGNGPDEEQTGVIVVRNPDVSAFLEQVGRLIADPAAFAHEPVFRGADGASNSTLQ
jgi:hypothetical protein